MLDKLKQLGWTEYEAKAYLALLQQSPSTGYRVARISGVPTAKVYEALARLVERGAVRALPAAQDAPGGSVQDAPAAPAQYAPVAPDEVMAGVRAQHTRLLDELSDGLGRIAAASSELPGEWLHGQAPILGRAGVLLGQSRQWASVCVPPVWESGLRAAITGARSRSVRLERAAVASGARGETSISRGESGLLRVEAGMRGGEQNGLLVLAVDGTHALIATPGPHANAQEAVGFATHATFLVQFCAEWVRMRRALLLAPDAEIRLQKHDAWLDWEEAKQRRLLQTARPARPRSATPS